MFQIRNSDLKYDPPAALVQKVRQDNLNFFHQVRIYKIIFNMFEFWTSPNIQLLIVISPYFVSFHCAKCRNIKKIHLFNVMTFNVRTLEASGILNYNFL